MARVLVIDDEISIRETVQELLEQEGHEVETASEGEAGLRSFQMSPADLVITDLVMPTMNGFELIRELIREYPEVKIIAMSGAGSTERVELALSKAVDEGATSALRKPFVDYELLEAVRDALAT